MIFYQVVITRREGEGHRGFFETEIQAVNWAELETAWERLGAQLVKTRPVNNVAVKSESVESVVIYRCQIAERGSSSREEICRRHSRS